MCAKTSYRQAQQDVELLTGMTVSAKTQARIVERNPISEPTVEQPLHEVALDGGMVRLVTPKGEPSEWKQYKAVRLNATDVGMAWYQDNDAILKWLGTLCMSSLLYCLGDGHAGIWSLYRQLSEHQAREEILDWFHLMENLHKVGGSIKRLEQAESLLWQGKVDEAVALLRGLNPIEPGGFETISTPIEAASPNMTIIKVKGCRLGLARWSHGLSRWMRGSKSQGQVGKLSESRRC